MTQSSIVPTFLYSRWSNTYRLAGNSGILWLFLDKSDDCLQIQSALQEPETVGHWHVSLLSLLGKAQAYATGVKGKKGCLVET